MTAVERFPCCRHCQWLCRPLHNHEALCDVCGFRGASVRGRSVPGHHRLCDSDLCHPDCPYRRYVRESA